MNIITKRGDELRSMPASKTPMLIEGFLGEGKSMLFYGKGGIGKSILTLQAVSALTSGEPFLDKFKVARKCKVSYVQGENTEEGQRNLWTRVGLTTKQIDENYYNHYADILGLDTLEGIRALQTEIAKYWTPDVIVIDPIYKAIRTGSINDDHICNILTQNLDALRSTFKCAVILNHHEHRTKLTQFGKKIEEGTDAIAGSFILSGWATGSFQLVDNSNSVDTEKFRKLINAKDRDDNLVNELDLRLVGDGTNLDDPLYYEIVDPAASPQGYRKLILATITTAKTIEIPQIMEITGVERHVVGSVVRQLLREKLVTLKGTEVSIR